MHILTPPYFAFFRLAYVRCVSGTCLAPRNPLLYTLCARNALLDPSFGPCSSNRPHCGRPNMGRTMDHFGTFRAIPPKTNPILGSLCTKTVIWPYLGLRGSNCDSEGTFSRYDPPQLL